MRAPGSATERCRPGSGGVGQPYKSSPLGLPGSSVSRGPAHWVAGMQMLRVLEQPECQGGKDLQSPALLDAFPLTADSILSLSACALLLCSRPLTPPAWCPMTGLIWGQRSLFSPPRALALFSRGGGLGGGRTSDPTHAPRILDPKSGRTKPIDRGVLN